MIDILAGTPLADMVQQAQQAMAEANIDAAANYYEQCLVQVGEFHADPKLRRALWIEHVVGLIGLERYQAARLQAQTYIAQAQALADKQAEDELLILLAECSMAEHDLAMCRQYLEYLSYRLEEMSDKKSDASESNARLIRLWGLMAAEEGDYVRSKLLLNDALIAFTELGSSSGQRTLTTDLMRLALLAGNGTVVTDILERQAILNTYELLIVARALRRDARYETATKLLERRLEIDIEPTLRFHLLHELVLLYQILADQKKVDNLIPLLDEAASVAANQHEAKAAVERLRRWHDEGFSATDGVGFDARIFNVRASIQQNKLDKAEEDMRDLLKEATTPRYAAYWSLVAGELEFALGVKSDPSDSSAHGKQALAQLGCAAKLASENSLPEVYSQSVRLMGRVHEQIFRDLETASDYWARAGGAEELIAHRQETDQARIRYLEALPTAYDELIEATARRVTIAKAEFIAPVIAAMETARGGAILSSILPANSEQMRDLPSLRNPAQCVAWFAKLTQRLSRNMAIWILHSTSHQLHHGLLAKGLLHWVSIPIERQYLSEQIEELKGYWELSPDKLEEIVRNDPFLIIDSLVKLSKSIQLDRVLATLPKKITRLAVVAGDALGDIPFAALPVSCTDAQPPYLLSKFAISELPCLSAQYPIELRSASARGSHRLVIQPPAPDISGQVATHEIDTSIAGPEATITSIQNILRKQNFPIVRFNCHGKHWRNEVLESWLQLAPDQATDGRLTVQGFQELLLGNCGTLILGACESGMSHRLGRDERLGFVRAGFAAGAASILASRWIAANLPAATILDRFERNLRYLPRDQALQKAQIDFIHVSEEKKPKGVQSLVNAGHPARWACWTLYGDPGLQTDSNWFVRNFQRLFNQ